MAERNIPFSPPDMSEEEVQAVAEVLRTGWITTGPKTKLFENKIAEDIKQRSINISDVFCCEHIDFLDSDSVRKPFLPKLTGKQYKKEMNLY